MISRHLELLGKWTLFVFFIVHLGAGCTGPSQQKHGQVADDLATAAGRPRWFLACPSNYAAQIAPLVAHRRKQSLEVVPVPSESAEQLRTVLQRHGAGQRAGDSLLIVGAVTPGATGSTGRMSGVATDSPLGYVGAEKIPRLAVGRLPARSGDELAKMVRKILDFERQTAPGDWQRKVVCLVANPIAGAESMAVTDWFINQLSKRSLKSTGKAWRTSGAADIRGHPLRVPSDEFPDACLRAIRDPYAVLAFFGHSNENMMVSQKQIVLESSDFSSLSRSSSHGIFFSCGCYALRGEANYGKSAIRAAGGPVAVIGALEESYAAIGYLAGGGLLEATTASLQPATVGDWWLAVQKAILRRRMSGTLFKLFDSVDGSHGNTSLAEQRLEHAEMWNLLGDPATRMPSPH